MWKGKELVAEPPCLKSMCHFHETHKAHIDFLRLPEQNSLRISEFPCGDQIGREDIEVPMFTF